MCDSLGERYGIDWDHASAVNPRLIHLTHTPFGPDGPDADVGGYDTLVQGPPAVGYPCGPYHLPYDALEGDQVRANGFAAAIEHPVFGKYTTSCMPLRFSAVPNVPYGPSPGFGQHTVGVLTELGFTREDADQMLAARVVRAAD